MLHIIDLCVQFNNSKYDCRETAHKITTANALATTTLFFLRVFSRSVGRRIHRKKLFLSLLNRMRNGR